MSDTNQSQTLEVAAPDLASTLARLRSEGRGVTALEVRRGRYRLTVAPEARAEGQASEALQPLLP